MVLLAATVTDSPGVVNASAGPVAAGAPVQSAVGYSRTVDPGSAVPWTDGVVLWLGEAGVTLVNVGCAGATESLT